MSRKIISKMKEYKGEKIAARLRARLIPPSSKYPGGMCEFILTTRHLYVLEDNFDGTYEAHFALSDARIRDIKAEVKGRKYKKSTFGELFIKGCMAMFEGILYPSGCVPLPS